MPRWWMVTWLNDANIKCKCSGPASQVKMLRAHAGGGWLPGGNLFECLLLSLCFSLSLAWLVWTAVNKILALSSHSVRRIPRPLVP